MNMKLKVLISNFIMIAFFVFVLINNVEPMVVNTMATFIVIGLGVFIGGGK